MYAHGHEGEMKTKENAAGAAAGVAGCVTAGVSFQGRAEITTASVTETAPVVYFLKTPANMTTLGKSTSRIDTAQQGEGTKCRINRS